MLTATPTTNMVQIVQSAGGAWIESTDKEKIQSTLQGGNVRFCVTLGGIVSQENQKAEEYFIYVLDKQNNLRETSVSRKLMQQLWFHTNSANLHEIDIKVIFDHVQEHADWHGYKKVV